MTNKLITYLLFFFLPQMILAQGVVWPGDVTNNGVVNEVDLLYLGYAYGAEGTSRDSITGVWEGQTIPLEWQDTFPNGLNFAYADCNGDGVVNDDDIQVIIDNLSLTHADVIFMPDELLVGIPGIHPRFLVPPGKKKIKKGQTTTVDIFLGSEDLPIDSILGVAFVIQLDSLVFDLSQTDFVFNGWLDVGNNRSIKKNRGNNGNANGNGGQNGNGGSNGNNGNNGNGNANGNGGGITAEVPSDSRGGGGSSGNENNPENDFVVAYTKTDRQPVSGDGKIGELTVALRPDFVIITDIPDLKIILDSIHVVKPNLEKEPIAGTVIELELDSTDLTTTVDSTGTEMPQDSVTNDSTNMDNPMGQDSTLVDNTTGQDSTIVDNTTGQDSTNTDSTMTTSIEDPRITAITLFPNPTHGKITLKALEVPLQQVIVYNTSGQVLLHQPLRQVDWQEISIESLPIGLYIIRIQTEYGIKTETVLKL